jgi:hypothetical protein
MTTAFSDRSAWAFSRSTKFRAKLLLLAGRGTRRITPERWGGWHVLFGGTGDPNQQSGFELVALIGAISRVAADAHGIFRRIFLLAAHPGEGRLTEPISLKK